MPPSPNEHFRDFVRFTGDGLPGEPLNAPLPWGDSESGVHNPDKKDFRDAMNWLLSSVSDLIAGYEGSSLTPFVLLGIGQSNMRGFVASTTGTHATGPGVYFWNAPNGAPVSAGTQFNPAQFGVPPLDNYNSDQGVYANNLLLHAARAIRAKTGRPVYVIMIARGEQQVEAFMSSATLAANGWARGSNQDLYSQLMHALSVGLAQVPGAPAQVDAVMIHQGEANNSDGPELYARKLKAALLDLETAGYISRERTPVVLGEIAPGATDTNWARHRAGILRFKEAWGFDRWKQAKTVSVAGLDVTDTGGVHFTGASLVALGERYADAYFSHQPDEIMHPNTTDYTVNAGLRWATNASFQQYTDYAARKPPGLDSPIVSFVDSPVLGPAWQLPANTSVVMAHRNVVRLPMQGLVSIDYEIVALGPTSVPHRAFVYCYGGYLAQLDTVLSVPGSSPVATAAGVVRVRQTFKRPGSSAVADVTLPANVQFISPGIWIGAGSASGPCAFNILDMRVG